MENKPDLITLQALLKVNLISGSASQTYKIFFETKGFLSVDEGGMEIAQFLNQKSPVVEVGFSIGRDGHERLHDLKLALANVAGESVPEKIRERFGEQVKFAVDMKPMNPGDNRTLFSEEQMTIRWNEDLSATQTELSAMVIENFFKVGQWRLIIQILRLSGKPATASAPQQLGIDEHVITQTILEDELFSDLIISAGNGAEIKAHRAFLSAASPVLRAMFKNKMKESITGTLDMTTMSEKSVKAFLRYVYSKDLTGPKEDMDIAFDLLSAAHEYHMPNLEALMATQLEEAAEDQFEVQLAFRMLSFVRVWNPTSPLKNKAVRILKSNQDELGKLPEYRKLFHDEPAMEFCRYMWQTD